MHSFTPLRSSPKISPTPSAPREASRDDPGFPPRVSHLQPLRNIRLLSRHGPKPVTAQMNTVNSLRVQAVSKNIAFTLTKGKSRMMDVKTTLLKSIKRLISEKPEETKPRSDRDWLLRGRMRGKNHTSSSEKRSSSFAESRTAGSGLGQSRAWNGALWTQEGASLGTSLGCRAAPSAWSPQRRPSEQRPQCTAEALAPLGVTGTVCVRDGKRGGDSSSQSLLEKGV